MLSYVTLRYATLRFVKLLYDYVMLLFVTLDKLTARSARFLTRQCRQAGCPTAAVYSLFVLLSKQGCPTLSVTAVMFPGSPVVGVTSSCMSTPPPPADIPKNKQKLQLQKGRIFFPYRQTRKLTVDGCRCEKVVKICTRYFWISIPLFAKSYVQFELLEFDTKSTS